MDTAKQIKYGCRPTFRRRDVVLYVLTAGLIGFTGGALIGALFAVDLIGIPREPHS